MIPDKPSPGDPVPHGQVPGGTCCHHQRQIIPLLRKYGDKLPVHDAGIKCVQEIIGGLLYYTRAVDNKLLVAISEIGSQQTVAIEQINQAITKLLDYVVAYPNNETIYQASDMILTAHADTEYLNVTKECSRVGSYIMLTENDPVPCYNVPILTIAQIIKYFMSSANEA